MADSALVPLPDDNLLIVFTDEVGSTSKDEAIYKSVLEDPALAETFQADMVSRRCTQFAKLANELILANELVKDNELAPTKSQIVKNVGDALVITLQVGEADSGILLSCLGALYRAWTALGSEIRVAAHLCPIRAVATGSHLESFIHEIQSKAEGISREDLEDLWPALALIAIDVFGAPMNRAARLAGVPHGAQFVVSEEVAIAMSKPCEERATILAGYRENIDPIMRWRLVEEGRSILNANFTAVSDLVPLIGLKNIDNLSFKEPWWTLEFRPASAEPNLIKEFKKVQAIRIIAVAGDSLTEESFREASESLRRSIVDRETCTSFFVDLLLKVEKAWGGFPIRRSRDFKNDDFQWEQLFIPEENRKGQPSYILFTGCPDLTTDTKLRDDRLSLEDDDGEWKLMPTTMRIHKTVVFDFDKVEVSIPTTTGYFLVEFQVRRGSGKPSDSLEVFNGIRKYYGNGKGLHTLAYGLLEGETDGFILFHTPSFSEDQVLRYLAGTMDQGDPGVSPFFNRIGLTTIYSLSLDYRNHDDEIWQALRLLDPRDRGEGRV